jgi:hypothetical protein
VERISIPESIIPTSRIEPRDSGNLSDEGKRKRPYKPSNQDDDLFEPDSNESYDLNELA